MVIVYLDGSPTVEHPSYRNDTKPMARSVPMAFTESKELEKLVNSGWNVSGKCEKVAFLHLRISGVKTSSFRTREQTSKLNSPINVPLNLKMI